MNATVLYSKIANSQLPAEIEGEEGNIHIDRIQTPVDIRFYPRQAPASGHEKRAEGEDISSHDTHNEYYHEIKEFIDIRLKPPTFLLAHSLLRPLTYIFAGTSPFAATYLTESMPLISERLNQRVLYSMEESVSLTS